MRAPGRTAFAAGSLLLICGLVVADEPRVWSLEDVEFTKADFSNYRLPANQDRITPGVWLTRGDDHGLINYAGEFDWLPASPYGTEWAFGSAADWLTLGFQTWPDWSRNNPGIFVGQPAVLHLIERDVYLDLRFLSYSGSGSGGGFSYERATEGVPGEKVWTGEPITFTKADYADLGIPANQDRIVPGVRLTRNDRREIFNVAREASENYQSDSTAPAGTEWAWGTTADLADLFFAPWRVWAGQHPPGTVGKSAVLHLVEDDVYIDIRFLSWTPSNSGGGFSYERATEGVPGERIWTGPPVTFTKADSADWNLEANQDRITAGVWITRQNSRGIYNAKREASFLSTSPAPGSPCNTEWAFGTAADWEFLTFQNWYAWHGGNPQGAVGRDAVLHLVQEDVYLDVRFLSYAGGGPGGGFSWRRATEGVPGEKVWTGAPITFTRPGNVDWRGPANQDRITRHTWIARQNTGGLFNASFERGYEASSQFQSPVLTEWAFGTAADWESLSFQPFRNWRYSPTSAIIGKDAVLHLLDRDAYLDIRFTSWTSGGNGGGFSYERATEGVPGEKVWSGPKIVFTRADGGDVGDPASQDRITTEVWLSRRDVAGPINVTREPGFELGWKNTYDQPSPLGTEWAVGRASEWRSLTFYPWYSWTRNWRSSRVPDVVGTSAVLHLLEEDVYLDVRFSFWASSDSGGGFTYVRATEGVPGEKAWTGPPILFSKPGGADPYASGDPVAASVRLARGDKRGLYNALLESGWETPLGASSGPVYPSGTEWAYGRAADWKTLAFRPWKEWVGGAPLDALFRPAVVHLVEDDVYVDITFTGWTSNGRGGGFSYRRASPKVPMASCAASGKINFAVPSKDGLKFRAEIGLTPGFSPAGKQVELDAGGVAAVFTLDAKGKGTAADGNGSIALKYNRRSGAWKVTAALRNGSFAGRWTDEGMVDGTLMIPVEWTAVMKVGGLTFLDTDTYTWKAKKGRSGSFR